MNSPSLNLMMNRIGDEGLRALAESEHLVRYRELVLRENRCGDRGVAALAATDIRAIVEPHTQADPELKTARRYCNFSAAEVLEVLRPNERYRTARLPSERTMRDILNRMNYRLRPIRKSKPLKKTEDTDAIFDNVAAVKAEETGSDILEISVDTKAKVNEGEYSRGGKNPDGFER
jgi:hypothetical protein